MLSPLRARVPPPLAMVTVSACAVVSARLAEAMSTALPRQLRGFHDTVRSGGVKGARPRQARMARISPKACHRCIQHRVFPVVSVPRKDSAMDQCTVRYTRAKAGDDDDVQTQPEEKEGAKLRNTNDDKIEKTDDDDSIATQIALALIRFYRTQISPLTPPSCRFVPTCSGYAVESFKKFGPAKGLTLTAWRILRCNPWGGVGYDPPRWPPVGIGKVAGDD